MTSLPPQVVEECLLALANKNPSVKTESCLFLTRCIRGSTQKTLTKVLLKSLCPVLVTLLAESAAVVREAATEALGAVSDVIVAGLVTS